MQPQGSAIINQAWFDKTTAELNAIDKCADLQAIVNAAFATLSAEVAAVRAQIAALLPLLTLPTSLGAIISWISSFGTGLTAPYLKYVAQLAQLLSNIATLTAAATAAAGRILNCAITVPPIT